MIYEAYIDAQKMDPETGLWYLVNRYYYPTKENFVEEITGWILKKKEIKTQKEVLYEESKADLRKKAFKDVKELERHQKCKILESRKSIIQDPYLTDLKMTHETIIRENNEWCWKPI